MTQINKYFLASLFFSIVCQLSLFAQADLSVVQAQMASYTKTRLPEKLFVHTDKSFYTAGEIMWFKIYAVDGLYHQALPASKVAYVEIMDNNQVPVSQTKIAMTEKGGDGSVQLPLSLRSGYYIIRAYTNWMKNLGADHFFEKQITIVNPLKSPEIKEEKTVPAYSLQLFAEGGNLVSGLSSNIGFHLTDKNGKGVQGQGYLLNEKNDTLSSFVPYKFGMGHFNLKPQNGTSYKVIFKLADGSTVSQPLPEISETGFTMKLEEKENDKLQITVQAKGVASNIYLLVQTRQVVKAEQKNVMINENAVFTIDKKLLGEGVSQFTVFDSEKRPVCERLFFLPPAKTKNKLKMSKEQYGSRDRVEISLDSLSSGQSNLSLSVYQLDELPEADPVNVDHYLWLTSELTGRVEQPAYYFSDTSEEVKQATEYLMLTHGWRRFKWDAVLHSQAPVKFPRERSGHLITGRVTDIRTNELARNVQVFLSVPASPQKLFASVSDSNGLVQFEVRDYYGSGEIFVQTDRELDSTHIIEILSPFSETYTTGNLPSLSLLPSYQASLVNYSISMQAQHLYLSDSIQRFFKPSLSDTFPFYGKTMYSYRLDDYVRFNTMEEVLREYVREIAVGVKGKETSLRFKMFNEINREHYTNDILVTVDGIPLFNPDKIFLLDPLKIKQIDITPRNYIMGAIKFHGLANFSTYTNHYEGLALDQNTITIDYEGLQLQREFYSPDYSSELQRTNRLPDLRSTLYWAPNVNTNQVSFYTGDNRGHYLVLLQGIDKNGRPMSISSEIEVK